MELSATLLVRLPAHHWRGLARLLATAVLLFAALVWGGGQAYASTDMHAAAVPVDGQGAAERERGFREALGEVIVRMTGVSGSRANPEVRDLISNPDRFVQTYRYRTLDDDERERLAEREDLAEAPSHELRVTFSGSRLEEALRASEVPVWGKPRPELLLWVGVDDGRERYIVGEDDGEDARHVLAEQAERRGLPLLLPLLDLEDRDRIGFIDIRGPFLDAIEAASARYGADTRLIGYVNRRGEDEWIGDWTLLDGDRETRWRMRAQERDTLLAAGVDGATDRIASAAAGRVGERITLRIHVGAIGSMADYVRVAEYLGGLARVEQVAVASLDADTVRFDMVFDGRLNQLQRAIATGRLLDPAVSRALAEELAPEPEPVTAPGRILPLDELVEGMGADAARLAAEDEPDDPDERIELHYRLAS